MILCSFDRLQKKIAVIIIASGQTSESGTSLSAEPEDDKEAADLYQKLMQKEEDIQSANAKLWEKLFLTIDKDQVVSGDNNNYGDFLLKAIEAAKDQFTADELKIPTTAPPFCASS